MHAIPVYRREPLECHLTARPQPNRDIPPLSSLARETLSRRIFALPILRTANPYDRFACYIQGASNLPLPELPVSVNVSNNVRSNFYSKCSSNVFVFVPLQSMLRTINYRGKLELREIGLGKRLNFFAVFETNNGSSIFLVFHHEMKESEKAMKHHIDRVNYKPITIMQEFGKFANINCSFYYIS